MDFGQQIRAARAAKDWTREHLAEMSGVALSTLRDIENAVGESDVRDKTRRKLVTTFESAGIVFTPEGILQPKVVNTVFTGEGWFAAVLNDVYITLLDARGPELLVDMADDRESPPEIVALYRKLRNTGMKMRQTIEEGNTFMMGHVSEYRWIPKRHFNNWVTLIYGDKVAVTLAGESSCTVIKDRDLANTYRHKYNLVWELLPELTVDSTADERF